MHFSLYIFRFCTGNFQKWRYIADDKYFIFDFITEKERKNMAYGSRTPVTAIEFGTDKICVLHGCRDESGNAEVLAFAAAPSEGSVRKGSIVDPVKAGKILGDLLERADSMIPGHNEHRFVYYLLNGSSIASHRGRGSVVLHGGGTVTEEHIQDALEKANGLSLPNGVTQFSSYDSFFILDNQSRVKDPIGQIAGTLESVLHILTTDSKQIDTVNQILENNGFEYEGIPVFNGVASAFGVLRQEEREQGVLLIDFGQGACDYLLICADGIYHSGVLPVGVSHVANDLAIGLDLPYDFCLKFLSENRISKLRENGTNFLEYTASVTGKKRRIPLDSFEKIIELRFREIFSIIKQGIVKKKLIPCMTRGIVLCGGGAMLDGIQKEASQVFEFPVRIGEPIGITGVQTGFSNAMPCYAAILGLLKHALDDEAIQETGGLTWVRNIISSVGETVFGKIKRAKKVLEQ